MWTWWCAKARLLNTGRVLTECIAEGIDFVEPTCLPGRGTLIPVLCFVNGLFNERKLPHYGADFEFSIRTSRKGYRLVMSYEAAVASDVTATGIGGSRRRIPWSQFFRMFFTIRSKACLRYRYRFALLSVPWWALPTYLVFDSARVIGGAVRDQLLCGPHRKRANQESSAS